MELVVFTLKLMYSLACDWAFETGHALCSPGWPQLTSPLLHHLEWQNHMCVHQTRAHFNFIWRFQNKEQSRYLRYFFVVVVVTAWSLFGAGWEWNCMRFKAIPPKAQSSPGCGLSDNRALTSAGESGRHGQRSHTEKATSWRPKLEFLFQWVPFS